MENYYYDPATRADIIDAIAQDPTIAFPSMQFVRRGQTWQSPFKIDGTAPSIHRHDKTIIREGYKAALCNDESRESVGLIELYQRLNGGIDFATAYTQLSQLYNITPPEPSPEARARREMAAKQRDALDTIITAAAEALQADTPTAEAARAYLHGRGINDNDIADLPFGLFTPDLADRLHRLNPKCWNQAAGTTHPLAIIARAKGRPYSITFRRIDGDTPPKYIDIDLAASKRAHLFNLSRPTTGHRLIITEGEIDALMVQQRTNQPAAAAAGLILHAEALKEAIQAGYKRFVLLLDRDPISPQLTRRLIRTITDAARIIIAAGGECYVADLEQPEPEQKVDPASYLQHHTGEQLADIIDAAASAAMWIYDRIASEYPQDPPAQLFKQYIAEVTALTADPTITDPTDAAIIESQLNNLFGCNKVSDAIKQTRADRQREQTRQALEALTQSIATRLSDPNTDPAQLAADIIDRAGIIARRDQSSIIANLTRPRTDADYIQPLKEGAAGIELPFLIGGTPFVLHAGEVTTIAARTSNGKSLLAKNIARIITHRNEGAVLFFAAEETAAKIDLDIKLEEMGLDIGDRPFEALTQYYQTGRPDLFKAGTYTAFREREPAAAELFQPGRLQLYDDILDAATIADAIDYIAQRQKVAAVIVDYIQALTATGRDAKERAGDAMSIFVQAAKRHNIPIVATSQLNRASLSPFGITAANISDATEIEQKSATIVGLWHSSFKPAPEYLTNLDKQQRDIADLLFDDLLPGEARLFVKLLKNRNGAAGGASIFEINTRTGIIKTEPLC